ncbi:MAG: hypothetical protein N2747_02910 [Chitinophagaceae bacterium]|nr:hypothetical protein [Chitinophagaceae bacterium]
MYEDPDGKCPFCPWLDAVVDVAFVLYDVGVLVHEKVTTGKTSGANYDIIKSVTEFNMKGLSTSEKEAILTAYGLAF